MSIQSDCIAEMLRAANMVCHLSQSDIRDKLSEAARHVEAILEGSTARDLPTVVEAEYYLLNVCGSEREIHSSDAKAAFLYAVEIIQAVKKCCPDKI